MVTHAFLGRNYDATLRDQVLSLSTEQVYKRRSVLRALLGHAVTDTAPLRRTLEQAITPQIVDEVADAWLTEGRRLAVHDLDLDRLSELAHAQNLRRVQGEGRLRRGKGEQGEAGRAEVASGRRVGRGDRPARAASRDRAAGEPTGRRR